MVALEAIPCNHEQRDGVNLFDNDPLNHWEVLVNFRKKERKEGHLNVTLESASNGKSLNETPSFAASRRTELVFPASFRFGSATSSFQIEGAATADGKGPSIWDTFCAEEGRISDGSNGDAACDHYNLYKQDVALMARMGLDSYRFSIAWARIIPDASGAVNEAGLDFYERLVDELLANGITPMPTLYHWDLPQWLGDQDGWLNRNTAYAFADYAEAVVTRLGDKISTWTTLNEPFVSANHGYVTGEHAPGLKSLEMGFTASHHLMLAHGLAGQKIREHAPAAELSIVLNFTPTTPATDSPEDALATKHQDNIENWWYSEVLAGNGYPAETVDYYGWDQAEVLDGDHDIISAPIDMLGINFYTRSFVSHDKSFKLGDEVRQNTMGWEIHPPTLGWLLRELHARYGFAKMMITENGAPMPDDKRDSNGQVIDDDRIAYIRDHLAEVHGALKDGVPMVGYLVWSMFDNFEWAHGYGPRFGIVEVDYETQERRPKKSADWFSNLTATHQMQLD